jgi:hypothetical protein
MNPSLESLSKADATKKGRSFFQDPDPERRLRTSASTPESHAARTPKHRGWQQAIMVLPSAVGIPLP